MLLRSMLLRWAEVSHLNNITFSSRYVGRAVISPRLDLPRLETLACSTHSSHQPYSPHWYSPSTGVWAARIVCQMPCFRDMDRRWAVGRFRCPSGFDMRFGAVVPLSPTLSGVQRAQSLGTRHEALCRSARCPRTFLFTQPPQAAKGRSRNPVYIPSKLVNEKHRGVH
jgi:hypothetical protein